MKISTKGRYALRLMLDLALYGNGAALSLREVSGRQDISEKYLEQIVTHLTRANLVRSVRGAGGGYLLTRAPEEYTVGEILRALEGTLAPVSCVDGTVCCERAETCVTIDVWQEIQNAVSGVVDHITLADLVARHGEKLAAHTARARTAQSE
ncbi:MAG: Rrf2 family transcriptional regulator [Oscillospiraceae bacterium]|nr:Rrf2 family transcriptional regulator [Oscillospiraceae bacterium]